MPSTIKLNPSVSIPMRVIVDVELLPAEKATMIAILALARESDGFAPVTAKVLEAVTGVTHWSLRRHIRVLEERGLLYRGHQFEHKAMVGGCPWDECYGVYTAFTSNGKMRPWASDSPLAGTSWQAEALERLSAV